MAYLIVFKGLTPVVPEGLRDFVKKTISDEFTKFDVVSRQCAGGFNYSIFRDSSR